MDFKGPKGWRHPVGLLSILDDHSRYLTALHATCSTRTEPVREQLEQAFQHCGAPEAMLMDHGVPAYRWEHNHVRPMVLVLELWRAESYSSFSAITGAQHSETAEVPPVSSLCLQQN